MKNYIDFGKINRNYPRGATRDIGRDSLGKPEQNGDFVPHRQASYLTQIHFIGRFIQV